MCQYDQKITLKLNCLNSTIHRYIYTHRIGKWPKVKGRLGGETSCDRQVSFHVVGQRSYNDR